MIKSQLRFILIGLGVNGTPIVGNSESAHESALRVERLFNNPADVRVPEYVRLDDFRLRYHDRDVLRVSFVVEKQNIRGRDRALVHWQEPPLQERKHTTAVKLKVMRLRDFMLDHVGQGRLLQEAPTNQADAVESDVWIAA